MLIGKGRIQPSAELVFPPSGGAKTAKIIASILVGRDDVLPFVLLDSDHPGQQAAKSLRDSLYSTSKDRVVLTDEVFETMTNTEIEDLLPASLLVQVLDRHERRAERDFEDVHDPVQPIVPQIKEWAKKEGFDLSQDWKVRLSLGVKDKLLSNVDRHVDEAVLDRWSLLFGKFL